MNWTGNLMARRLLPVVLFLSLTNVKGQTTIDVSSACIAGTITLSQTIDEAGKAAFEGAGTVAGFDDIDVAVYWDGVESKWILAFDGQPFFYYAGDTDLPPNNNYGNWQQTTEGQSDCDATNKIVIGGSGTQNDPLPVTITSFAGRLSEKNILLEWATTEELDNDFFEIIHTTDLKLWKTLGYVNGNGTTKNTQFYSFSHSLPPGGVNYYRLKQIDFSGKVSLSYIINVKNPVKAPAIFPNPVENEFALLSDESTRWKKGEILDINGRPLQSIRPGTTSTQSLAAGKYFVRLKMLDGKYVVLPFVKTD